MKQYLNLIPWKVRCRILLRRHLRDWSIRWALLAMIGLSLYTLNRHQLSVVNRDLAAWHRRAATIEVIDAKNNALNRQIASLKSRLAKYGHLESEQIGFQLLGTISQSTEFNDGSIQVTKLTFKQTQVVETPDKATPVDPTKPPKVRDVRTVALDGVAANNLALAQFVSFLRDSGAFSTVDLKSSQENKLNTVASRNYQVECTF